MEIKQNLTNVNFNVGNNKQNKYIVIHYVGAVSSAYDNTRYFKNTYRSASANYFVDENEIWQCVLDKDVAWHCGGGRQGSNGGTYLGKCTNYNSIGIEMCCFMNNGVLDIKESVVNKTIELTKYLMNKYNIPSSNVIRHFDVTGKNCPAPMVANPQRWNDFKARLNGSTPKPTNQVNVYYRVKTQKHGWLGEVKNLNDYAGWQNSPITGVAIRVDKGSIRYRVHIKGGQWLPYVTGYDIKNMANGWAGNNLAIDLIEAYYYTPSNIRPFKKVKYRVNGLPWQYDNEKKNGQDGYAGIIGKNITKLEMIIE
jgi:N-acetylmuramoyl-L-alanine amidase CwlA